MPCASLTLGHVCAICEKAVTQLCGQLNILCKRVTRFFPCRRHIRSMTLTYGLLCDFGLAVNLRTVGCVLGAKCSTSKYAYPRKVILLCGVALLAKVFQLPTLPLRGCSETFLSLSSFPNTANGQFLLAHSTLKPVLFISGLGECLSILMAWKIVEPRV